MLRTLPQTRLNPLAQQALSIAAFTALTAISARVVIPIEPIPFTMQPLAVLLAGLLLGARNGAISQILYLALIAVGLPLDARMLGAAAFAGPTGGFLVGFVVCAFVAGLGAQWAFTRPNRRLLWLWLAAVAGIIALYALGVFWLASVTGLPVSRAFEVGGLPYLIPDLAKAIIAAAITAMVGGRLLRDEQPG